MRSALAACILASGAAAAQEDTPAHKTFYVPRDAGVAAVFFGASAGLSVFDVRIAHYFQDTSHYHVRIGQKLDNAISNINETTLTVGGLAVYGIARLAGWPTIADVSFHMAESVVATSLTAQVIRGPLGRTRPRDANPPYENQYDFRFFHGFTHFDQRSFPSIHSSSAFAAMSALVAEVKRRDPGATWAVAVPAYAVALTPGLARMYLGQHWASDIFSGAFLGTFYGWRIVDYSHTHPTTPVDRVFLGKAKQSRGSPAPFKIGVRVAF